MNTFSRRSFLKLTGLGALATLSGSMDGSAFAELLQAPPAAGGDASVVKSHCRMCPLGCGVDLYVQDGVIARVEGMVEDPESRGALCARGNALRSFVYDPDRIVHPLRRAGQRGEGRFERITWREALTMIQEQWGRIIQEDGPEAIAGYVGAMAGLEQYFLMSRLLYGLGSPNVFSSYPLGQASWAMGGMLTTGSKPCRVIENLDKSNCFVVWGSNPAASSPCFEPRWILDQRDKSGAQLIVIDPKITPLASLADEWVPIRPGTDGLLALAMAQVIITEKLFDAQFIKDWTIGYPGYREMVLRPEYAPENASRISGVPPEQIVAIARKYAKARPAVIIGGLGIARHSNAVQTSRAIHCLAALTGNVNRPGGNTYYSFPLEEFRGIASREERILGTSQMDKRLVQLPMGAGDPSRLWDLLLADGNDYTLGSQIFRRDSSEPKAPYRYQAVYDGSYSGKAYRLRSLLVQGGNPLVSCPSESKGLAAIRKLDFLVVVDPYVNQTAAYADLILPPALFTESTGLTYGRFPSSSHYLAVHEKAVQPAGESLSDQQIIRQIGRALGLGQEFVFSDEQFIDLLLSSSPFTSKITFEKLRASPTKKLALFNSYDPFPHPVFKSGFEAPGGKVMFYSTLTKDRLNPYPEWAPPAESPLVAPNLVERYPLMMVNGKSTLQTGSWTRNLPNLNHLHQEAWVEINPVNALQLQLSDGDLAYVESGSGRALLRVVVSDSVRPGVAWVVSSGGSNAGTSWRTALSTGNANAIIDDGAGDPFAGSPRGNEMLVRITKA